MSHQFKRKPVQVLDLSLGDTTNALLQIKYVGKRETTASGGTITIDNNGDDNSKLLITMVGWDAANDAADTKYYAASAYSAGSTDTTVTATLQSLIDAIETDDIGFVVRRAHGMSDKSTNSDDFVDLTATQFGEDYTNFLFRDSSEILTGWSGRAGVPGISGKGRIELLKLVGTGTYVSGSLTWKVSTDAGSAAASEVELFNVAGGATTVEATVFDFSTMENPMVVNGPVSVEAVATATSAVSAKLLYRPLD